MNGTILFVMYYDKYIYIYLYFLEFTVLTFIFYRFVLVTRCRTEMIGQGAYGIVSDKHTYKYTHLVELFVSCLIYTHAIVCHPFVMLLFHTNQHTGLQQQVYKGRKEDTNDIVAIKRIPFADSTPEGGVPCNVIREISLLRELDHPNVVRLFVVTVSFF